MTVLSVGDRKVLELLAKEFKIEQEEDKRIWSEIPTNYCFGKKQLERAVVLSRVAVEEESVGLKWLEKYCADTRTKVWKDGTKAFIDVDALLSAVRAKAKGV